MFSAGEIPPLLKAKTIADIPACSDTSGHHRVVLVEGKFQFVPPGMTLPADINVTDPEAKLLKFIEPDLVGDGFQLVCRSGTRIYASKSDKSAGTPLLAHFPMCGQMQPLQYHVPMQLTPQEVEFVTKLALDANNGGCTSVDYNGMPSIRVPLERGTIEHLIKEIDKVLALSLDEFPPNLNRDNIVALRGYLFTAYNTLTLGEQQFALGTQQFRFMQSSLVMNAGQIILLIWSVNRQLAMQREIVDMQKKLMPGNADAADYTEDLGKRMLELRQQDSNFTIMHREAEAQRIISITQRAEMPHALLQGKSGVGKDEVVKLVALKLATGDVPDQNKSQIGRPVMVVRAIDLQAGSGVVGRGAERLKAILVEARKRGAIIYFPEYTKIASMGSHTGGDAESLGVMMLREFEKAEIPFICTDTPEAWAEFVKTKTGNDTDRRLTNKVSVLPLLPEQILESIEKQQILSRMREAVERTGKSITIEANALREAVRLGIASMGADGSNRNTFFDAAKAGVMEALEYAIETQTDKSEIVLTESIVREAIARNHPTFVMSTADSLLADATSARHTLTPNQLTTSSTPAGTSASAPSSAPAPKTWADYRAERTVGRAMLDWITPSAYRDWWNNRYHGAQPVVPTPAPSAPPAASPPPAPQAPATTAAPAPAAQRPTAASSQAPAAATPAPSEPAPAAVAPARAAAVPALPADAVIEQSIRAEMMRDPSFSSLAEVHREQVIFEMRGIWKGLSPAQRAHFPIEQEKMSPEFIEVMKRYTTMQGKSEARLQALDREVRSRAESLIKGARR